MSKRPGSTTRVRMLDVRNGEKRHRYDDLATEEPIEIRVATCNNGEWVPHRVAVTMRTPGHDFELAVGFLFTEGVIADPHDVRCISYCVDPRMYTSARHESQNYNVVTVFLAEDVTFDAERLSRHVYTTSSCGVCGKTSLESVRTVCQRLPTGTFRLSQDYLLALPETLRHAQTIFERTGGLHASALFDADGRLVLLREDVGRHNALDKLIGVLFLEKLLPASNTVLLVSGRASFELVQKAVMAGIPVLASVGAPSSLAVELAKEFGMTLVGFLREGRFNVYSCPERLEITQSKYAMQM